MIKQIAVAFFIGSVSFVAGYEYCKWHLGHILAYAIANIDETKKALERCKDLMRRIEEDEVYDSNSTKN